VIATTSDSRERQPRRQPTDALASSARRHPHTSNVPFISHASPKIKCSSDVNLRPQCLARSKETRRHTAVNRIVLAAREHSTLELDK
jgi:hypothetical protein